MAEDDNFDIDIYGDDGPQDGEGQDQDYGQEQDQMEDVSTQQNQGAQPDTTETKAQDEQHKENSADFSTPQGLAATQPQAATGSQPPTQGTKRKSSITDLTAAPALVLSDLNWWQTDDDIRGWARSSSLKSTPSPTNYPASVEDSAEAQLVEITFSEHKVNGKSKGQVYVSFSTAAAATAVKNYIEGHPGMSKKPSIVFQAAGTNPYKTLPKDAPARATSNAPPARGDFRGGYRGRGRGGFQPRGGGGFQGNGGGGFPMQQGGGFGMGGMGGGFNSFGRGGMMQRGGRGGPRGGMGGMGGMMANPMMGGMGGMNMGMMNQMMGGFNQGFGGGGGFSQGGFGGNMGQGQWDNPHGAKRARGE